MSNRKGWVWGTTDGGEWLHIPGSYYHFDLAATPEEAPPYPANIVLHDKKPILALIEDLGHPYYRIIETAEEAL